MIRTLQTALLVLPLLLLPAPARSEGSVAETLRAEAASARAKACRSNLRTCEGATELFLMEMSAPFEAERTLGLDELVAGGFLKTAPACPEGGAYTILLKPGKSGPETRISCDKHGTAEEIRQAPPTAEPRKAEAANAGGSVPASPGKAAAAPAKGETKPLPLPANAVAPPPAPRPPATCGEHLKACRDAAERYGVDQVVTNAQSVAPAHLHASGYLKHAPKCPGGGVLSIELTVDGAAVSCSVHGPLD